MPSGTKVSRALAGKIERKKREPIVTLDDFDGTQVSQGSSDDGMMAVIAQQMQASLEKKKKDREAKFLQATQTELSRTLTEKAYDFVDGVAEIDKIYADFQDAYAMNEDSIRKLWDAILKEQIKLRTLVEERRKAMAEQEERREHEHIEALAHTKKACEDSQRLVDSLQHHSK